MSYQTDTPGSGGFFHERSGAGATFVSVLLIIFLLLGLIGAFIIHTGASVFEQRGLQRAMESFLKNDEVRSGVSETIQNTFPDDVITDAQVDALINDDTILEAAAQCAYDAFHFDLNNTDDFYDHVLDVLDDPSSASLYSEALDRFTEILGIDDETYRKAMEAVAEERKITLPKGETDKLKLATTVMRAAIDEQRSDLPQVTTVALTGRDSRSAELFLLAQRVIRLFETPKFILYNLLVLAVWYGLILLLKRSYRKPLLYCCIPYFLIGVFMLAAYGLLSFLISHVGPSGGRGAAVVADIAGGALIHSCIIAFCFAVPLLAAYITLTVLQRKRASRRLLSV